MSQSPGQVLISIENLGKKYLLGHPVGHANYSTLRDSLAEGVASALRRLWHAPRPKGSDIFWALRGVSFDVKRGEVVGIIGRNGAGKSTLLKILSRITQPTEGRVRIHGRVASLLEVGTGFHPELTGRDNIFLNGAILGMTRAEIRRKFEEIVAFAEVESFLDLPVKRYSSGMQVRLAFAVAAHLEPDLLIIDEVLAVGDAAFQRKCLGKVQAVSRSGRTVLFVSHNMAAVKRFCTRAVYLRGGRTEAVGPTDHIVREYLTAAAGRASRSLSGLIRFGAIQLLRYALAPNPIESGGALSVRWDLRAMDRVRLSEFAVLIHSADGTRVAILDLRARGLPRRLDPGQRWTGEATVKALPLVEGDYSVGLYAGTGEATGNIEDLITLTVGPRRGTGPETPYAAAHRGLVDLELATEQTLEAPG